MSALRPYLALDIETTGLDTDRVHVLQIGWVIDDGVSQLQDLQRGSVIIREPFITYGEPFALQMNAWLFQEMDKKEPKYPVKSPIMGLECLLDAVKKTSILAEVFDTAQGEKRPSKKVQLAGKNVSNFDWAILRRILLEKWSIIEGKQMVEWLAQYVDHRFIDCGAIFFSDFGKNPGFDKINKLIGWKDINHDALDDAINVVVAVRYKAGWRNLNTGA